MKLKVIVAKEDGEVLEHFTVDDSDGFTEVQLGRSIVDTLEQKFFIPEEQD